MSGHHAHATTHLDTGVAESSQLDEVDGVAALWSAEAARGNQVRLTNRGGRHRVQAYTGMVMGGDEGENSPMPNLLTAVMRNS